MKVHSLHPGRWMIRFILSGALILLALSGCAPATAIAPSETPVQVVLATDEPTTTPQPTATATLEPTATDTPTPAPPLLPAPLYFLSKQGGTQQVWRVEMNGGLAHPVTTQPAGVDSYAISPVDGRLAYVSNNDLFVSKADGSGAQRIVDGEDLDPNQPDYSLRISDPVWSPDGRAVAFARGGVNVMTLPSMNTRTLVANTVLDVNDVGAHRSYSPLFWSPDGKTLAVMIMYYEGAELGILPVDGGELMKTGLPTCCAAAGPTDATFFIGSVGGMSQAGLWQVQWNSGRAAQLSPVPVEGQYPPVYAQPYNAGDRLYYLFGSDTVPQIVRSSPLDLVNKEVLGQLTYLPGQALWSPDGSLMVITGRKPDEPLQVWTIGQEPRPLEVPGSSLKWGLKTDADEAAAQTPAPTFTPTPTLPALPASSQAITRDNVTRLQALTTVSGQNEVYSLAVSPDSRLLALGLESGVELWDMTAMQRTARLGPYGGLVPALSFSPNSRTLAAGSWDRSLDLWDVTTGQKIRPFTGHTDWVTALDFSPDGTKLASTSNDNKLILWDVASGAPLRIIDLHHWASDVSFSPDGKLLAVTGWDTDTTIYEVDSWNAYATIAYVPDRWVLNLQFSPDGKTLALGTWDYRIVLWDVQSRVQRNELFGHSDNPTGLTFSPDGSLLASAAEDGEMRIWDASTGAQLHLLAGDRSAAFTPDGRFLIAAGPKITGAIIYYVP